MSGYSERTFRLSWPALAGGVTPHPSPPRANGMELQSFPPDAIAEWGVRLCDTNCATKWMAHSEHQRALASKADAQLSPLLLNVSGAQPSPVSEMLFGLNLELVRHSMFAGLSAQLVANRLFGSKDGSWPPRWHAIGSPALHEPGVSKRNGTYAVACTLQRRADECGVMQTQVGQGFSSGPNNGSAIAVEAGRCYTARLVLRMAAGGAAVRVSRRHPNQSRVDTANRPLICPPFVRCAPSSWMMTPGLQTTRCWPRGRATCARPGGRPCASTSPRESARGPLHCT